MRKDIDKSHITYSVLVTGVVQGVGFRPFVLNLAAERLLGGTVKNTGSGVDIEVSGEPSRVASFISDLKKKRPPRAHIAEIVAREIPFKAFDGFRILPSSGKAEAVFVPVDTAVCEECARELLDPSDRRYLYPFINCTQCGPRYTIIKNLPYDRPATAMESFTMCPVCGREYGDPSSRRFHAQPNACPVCGPEVALGTLTGIPAVKKAAEIIDDGGIVAVKGIGGYHIICDAANPDAVRRLRRVKNRPTKPFAVMCRDIPEDLPSATAKAILSPNAPIVITSWGNPPEYMKAALKEINSLSGDVGLMQAYAPLHKVLLSFTKTPFIVATSANIKNEPIIADNLTAEKDLSHITPHFLHHNRPILNPADDSVAAFSLGEVRLLRRGRGYAPFPITLPKSIPPVFAAGAHLKAALTLTAGKYAFVSPYIGDTESAATQEFYKNTYLNMKRLLGFVPSVAVCDMHPDYFSTRFANSLGIPVVPVQHHHAHLYSVMAEHGVSGDVVGIIMDGTGYGTDGTIWGGEILLYADKEIRRAAHIERVLSPKGDAAQRFPSLMAASWLAAAGIWHPPFQDNSFWPERLGKSAALSMAALKAGINVIHTTSAGRLFEGVGALVLGIKENEYEAHAAMALEGIAGVSEEVYPYEVSGENIIFSEAIAALCGDIEAKADSREIAARWHNTFAAAVADAGIKVAKEAGVKDIALSGGVFQNRRLLEKVFKLINKSGFRCLIHKEVPSNDGGISLGQAYYICLYGGQIY
jgi:hydrogenase maturation protein HypF